MTGEERFQLIMENVTDFAIFVLNPEGRVADWNAGAEYLLGYTQQEAVGMYFGAFFVGENAVEVAEHELREAVHSGKSNDDTWHKRKDGTEFFANGITTALRDQNGTLRGFAKILRDRTSEKRFEEQLRKRNEELAEADRRKDEFLAVLGHELRNPLAPVFNALHILHQDNLQPDQQQLVVVHF